MDEISGRRVAGFVLLGLAILVGTLTFGFAMSSCQPATVQPTVAPSVLIVAPSVRDPQRSPWPDAPGPSIEIPPPIQ